MYEGQTDTYFGHTCNFVIKGQATVDIYYLNILYDL
jgi:hypothetical protein